MAVKQVDELSLSTAQRLKILSGDLEGEELPDPDTVELPEDLLPTLRCLPWTGTTIVFFKDESGLMVCQKLLKEQLDRVLIHESMFQDHTLGGYQELMEETMMQLQRTKGCC